MWQEFKKFLETRTDLSPLSVKTYITAIKACEDQYGRVTGETGEDYVCSAASKADKYKRYHAVKRYLAWAGQAKKLKPEQLTMTMEAPSKPKRASKAIHPAEYGVLIQTILDAPGLSEQDKTFFMVLAATGRRANEILTVRLEDVEVSHRLIKLFIVPKGSSERCGETWVYAEDREAFTRLQGHLNTAQKRHSEYLFEYPGKDPYQSVYYLWTEHVSERFVMHQLRHTALTKTANAKGGGVHIAQIQGGHKSIETTMGYVTVYDETYHSAMRNLKKA